MKHMLAIGAALALVAGHAAAPSAQEAKLRAANFLPSNQSFGIPFKRWVDEVNKQGKGIVQIDIVGPEAIPTPEQPNAVKTGVVDMHHGPGTFYRGTLIESEVYSLVEITIPEMKKNGSWAYLDKLHAEKMNVTMLSGIGYGMRFYVYTNRPVDAAKKDKPLDGFTLRVQPIYKAFFESIGAKTIVIAPAEVYTALERNMVNGYGWPLVGLKDLGWLALTKHRLEPGFFNVATQIMVNLERWNKLDKRQQDFLVRMSDWLDQEWPKWRDQLEAAEDKIQRDGGVNVIQMGPEWRKRAQDAFWAELEKASPQHVAHLRKLVAKP
jgi:TRAP-type C4-dicarboxylate transport system substrate-binding protein